MTTSIRLRWYAHDEGHTIGLRGSENGVIIYDEEFAGVSRITLEREGYQPFSITCGISGWMVHTRFFQTEVEATQAFAEMKMGLARIVEAIPGAGDNLEADLVSNLFQCFIEEFP